MRPGVTAAAARGNERPSLASVAADLARLSCEEIEAALHLARAPGLVRGAARLLARVPSARLGRVLARFDGDLGELGLPAAAARTLAALGASLDVEGACPTTGGVLVVTNHPGAFDGLALIAALAREDVAIVATDRAFLRAMPQLSERLVLVPEPGAASAGAPGRARGARKALEWLRAGKVLIQFGAGAIEPDAAFADAHRPYALPWTDGTGLLAGRAAHAGAQVVPCFVSGVHSPRAKRLPFVRWAESRGITTIAPLVQATIPGFRDVRVTVRIGAPIDAAAIAAATSTTERTAIVRSAAVRLAGR